MSPIHHPSVARLDDYILGCMDPAFRLVLEAHLAFCDRCRAQISGLASNLEDPLQDLLPKAGPPAGLLASLLAKVRSLPALSAPRCGQEVLPLPSNVWSLLPDMTLLTWQGALSPGFRFLRLPTPQSGAELLLLHLRKGHPFPRHGHLGTEQSMILCGGLRDEFRVLEAGDYEESTSDKVHRPAALPDEDCWLVSSVVGSVQFTGWRRWLQG